ncbi:hypothetical protein F4694_001003 [Bacillus niacini]|uniref:Stress-response A/B barrel domain-containing protein n=1 Tax=Neobacillus niacini TaxID=86668 RepID=A0A852T8T6_9BACI|nr:Dabb family protein [Neobacillus niacini]NYE04259.1 hypothetical protein [Neobacillus niacini]
MIKHIVLFKFSQKTTNEQKEEVILRLKSLKEEINGIIDIFAGINFSQNNSGFEIGLAVLFSDRNAFENYGPHPKHQEVVSYLKKVGMTDITILDFLVLE